MHKIKKGIKKKIKGKKDREDELFTEEEYERYKKQKEEESKLHECPTESEKVETATPVVEYTTNSSNSSPPEAEENGTENKEDWRNFLSTTDTVLKKSSENLEQIKDTSYFQVKKVEKEEAEVLQSPSVTPVPVAAPHKNWVDLHKGLDDEEESEESPKAESPKKPIELRVRELKEIAPIEALPSVDVEDYADIFDTTYVDQVESGEVQLYIIPDSPSEDEFNDLELFDTSIVDKVLAPKEPKKKKTKKGTKKEAKKVFKKEPVKEEPAKKKQVLVNLGSAVNALTKGEPVSQEGKTKPGKKQSPKKEEVDLLFSDAEALPPPVGSEEVVAEPDALDSILFSDEPVGDLPEVVCPIQAVTADKTGKEDKSDSTKPVIDVNEFLELTQANTPEKTDCNNLQILVAEFEPGTTLEVEVVQPTEYKAVDDDIKDEVDAEFAVLAAESIAKEKDKSICELGIVEGDDPFDTSSIAQVLGEPKAEGLETSKPEKSKSPVDLLASENVECDPFDTSAVHEVLPVDPFETSELAKDLPEGLKPEAPKENPLEGGDPFDTSVAAEFGKTELRVLEGELLSNLRSVETDDDFDFDPRANELEIKKEVTKNSCLLSSELECLDAPVLAPQSTEPLEEVDPFDTSFAEKVQIQSLEAELLSTVSSSVGSNVLSEAQHKKKCPPRPPSPSCRSTVTSVVPKPELDPFDTSIAEGLTKAEPVHIVEEPKQTHLGLDLRPPRPPSPACLLTTTPLDENPTLLPTSKTPEVVNKEETDDFDPFDTSIAEQFGKTELRVLETELLVHQKKAIDVSPCSDFNPRAEEYIVENSIPKVPSPDTLLASHDTEEQTLPPLSPDRKQEQFINSEIDPFDTSVADKLGQSELSFFEIDTSANTNVAPVQELKAPAKPVRPNPPHCIFESTPTDENPTLLPASESTQPEPEFDTDIDPFDTSIAEKFGNTELKAIEKSILSQPNESIQAINHIASTESERTKSVDDILSYSPTAGTLPVLQPIAKEIEVTSEEEIDPFDTSIAASFGETELKVLERELLAKSPQCDDDFDPRQGEN